MNRREPKPGVCWMSSASDSRWNVEWRSEDISIFDSSVHREVRAQIARLEKELGAPPPDDLEFGAMKD